MRKLLIAGVVAGLVTAAAPVASAHPFFDFRGGCILAVANDELPTSPLGGPTQWNGVAAIALLATRADGITPAPTAPISGRCDLYINAVYQGTIVTAPPATGASAGAALTSFTANPWDVVDICAEVVVNGEPHTRCNTVTTSQVVPQPVVDLAEGVKQALDPIVCPLFAPLAPGVPPFVTVDPASGDVSVLGDVVYDCPPYAGYPTRPLSILTTQVMTLVQV